VRLVVCIFLSFRLMGIHLIHIAMEDYRYADLDVLARAIGGNEVDNLLDLDWSRITGGFESGRLMELVLKIEKVEHRVVAVRACLMRYRTHLVQNDYAYYLETWDGDCQFREFCELILDGCGEHELYCLSSIGTLQCAIDLPGEFCTPYANELIGRLIPEYCDKNGFWKQDIGLSFISQVAHVLSGLLNIAQKRKWTYFEKIWHVRGLAKAYCQREGRAIDAEVRKLYPEYLAY